MRPFARVKRADTFPGHCIRCQRIDDLIDLGAEPIPAYGTLMLCWNCFSELVEGLGFVTGDQFAATVAALRAENTKLEIELVLSTSTPRSTPHGDLRPDPVSPDGVRDPGAGSLADSPVDASHERGDELVASLHDGAADGAAGDVRVDTGSDPDGDSVNTGDPDDFDPAFSAGTELEGDVWDVLSASRTD